MTSSPDITAQGPAGTAPPRVLLVNHWHDDNRGDSAITQGVLTLLRAVAPASTATVVTLTERGEGWERGSRHLRAAVPGLRVLPCPVPTELRGRFSERSRPRVAADLALWAARSAPLLAQLATGARTAWAPLVADHDVVVLDGGSNIFDDGGVPAPLSLLRLAQVLSVTAEARRQHRTCVALGHTLGPFARAAAQPLLRRTLAHADLAVVREARSVQTARSVGVAAVEEAPDMAFALSPARTPAVDQALGALPWSPSRTLVLSVRQHPTSHGAHDDRLVAQFAAAARVLVAAGDVDGVAVVAHTTGPTPVEDDRPLSRRLAAALEDVPAVLVDVDASPQELSAFYGACAAVVAVRLHAAILALAAGTPTFAVAYLTGKTHGVMAQVGLPDAVGEFATVTADELAAGVRRLLGEPGLRERLVSAAGERRAHMLTAAPAWLRGELSHGEAADRATAAHA